ncbi:MAG: Ig-like domain-containing protein, partial [Chlorobi bacterium]|nr:Ig-like domain-containing protein [Chlorobiota bacterium]
MKFRIREKELRILLLISILIFGACANSQPPSGGPADTVPPTISGNVPENKTRHFSRQSVEIEFSKYMNRAQVNESIFISPSVKYQTDWSGKNLEIEFTENLDSNTTYSILLGTEYSDIRGNKPEKAFLLIFSTGESLDSGAITGKLFDPKPAGAFIFAHRIDNIDPDTLDIRRVKPDYRTQVGTNGEFEFGALKNGEYRLTAVRDEYKDEIYDEGTDAFGASLFDAVVEADTIPYLPIRIGPPVDNQGPMLFGAEALKDKIFILSFNERIDSSTVNGKSFSISDSLNLIDIEIRSAYPDHKNATRVIIETSEAVDTLKVWKLTCAVDSEFSLKDSLKNSICDTAFVSYFLGFHEADTTLPLIVEYP